jgi:hypothetical protein
MSGAFFELLQRFTRQWWSARDYLLPALAIQGAGCIGAVVLFGAPQIYLSGWPGIAAAAAPLLIISFFIWFTITVAERNTRLREPMRTNQPGRMYCRDATDKRTRYLFIKATLLVAPLIIALEVVAAYLKVRMGG